MVKTKIPITLPKSRRDVIIIEDVIIMEDVIIIIIALRFLSRLSNPEWMS
jgi:hypothetical protein